MNLKWLFGIAVFACSSCALLDEEKESDSSSEFKNQLTVGIAADYTKFALIGEGPILYCDFLPMAVHWRLESKDDMGGSPASLVLQKSSDALVYTTDTTMLIQNPQSYGHILMSSFAIKAKGYYRMIGSLTAPATKVIDTCTFEVK